MPELILRTQLADGRTIAQPISAFAALAVEPGATYTIVDAQTQEAPVGLAFERKDEDLEIQLEGEPVVVLDDFYTAETAATFGADDATFALASADLPAVSEAGALDTSDLPPVSDGGLLSIPAGATLTNPLTWGTPGLIGAGVVGAAGVGTGVGVAVSDDSSSSDSPGGPDTSVVVFDLVDGDSSDHSDQTFDPNVAYTIYIRVPSAGGLNGLARGESWQGGGNLGADDLIVLVGDGGPVRGFYSASDIFGMSTEGNWIYWSGSSMFAMSLSSSGSFYRFSTYTTTTFITESSSTTTTSTTTDTAFLWSNSESSWSENPNGDNSFSQAYLTTMPAGVLTSQGLA